jgi:hypothetical protein
MKFNIRTERSAVPSPETLRNISFGEYVVRAMKGEYAKPAPGDRVTRRLVVEMETTARAPLSDLARKLIVGFVFLGAFVVAILALRATDVADTEPTTVVIPGGR